MESSAVQTSDLASTATREPQRQMLMETLRKPDKEVANASPKNDTVHIGLCMAGAVSAGAYTAGMIDYLIEALERD